MRPDCYYADMRMLPVFFTIVFLAVPLFSHAQGQMPPPEDHQFILGHPPVISVNANSQRQMSEPDLSSTIRNALLLDPRTANLSEAELNRMIDTLTAQAVAQGITPHDMYWRPTLPHTIAASDAAALAQNDCGQLPRFLCDFNHSLGFKGSDMSIPIALGVLAALILALFAGYLELQHRNTIRSQAL